MEAAPVTLADSSAPAGTPEQSSGRDCEAGSGDLHLKNEPFAFPVFFPRRRKKTFENEDEGVFKLAALESDSTTNHERSGGREGDMEENPGEARSGDGPSAWTMRCPVIGCGVILGHVADLDAHYAARHRHACSVCRKFFPSSRLLSIHVSEAHDSFFQAKAARGLLVFECLVETCEARFTSDRARLQHLVQKHQFPASFKFHGTSAAASHPSQKQRRKEQRSRQNLLQQQHQNHQASVAPSNARLTGGDSSASGESMLEAQLDRESSGRSQLHQDCSTAAAAAAGPRNEGGGTRSQDMSQCGAGEAMTLDQTAPVAAAGVAQGSTESESTDSTETGQPGALSHSEPGAASSGMEVDVESSLSQSLSRLSCGGPAQAFVPRQVCFGRRAQRGTVGVSPGGRGKKGNGAGGGGRG